MATACVVAADLIAAGMMVPKTRRVYPAYDCLANDGLALRIAGRRAATRAGD